MLRLCIGLAASLAFFAFDTKARAHDLKVLASHLVVEKPGERTTIYLSWGHTLPVDDLVDAKTVERYDLVSPSGSATALKKEGLSLQTNVVELKEAGVHQVLVSRKPTILTHVVDKEGNRLMKFAPKSKVTEGTIEDAIRSQQFAKALIVTGQARDEAVKPAGLPLELVPLEKPSAWRSGGQLRFQVLFDGKPVPAESVLARYVGFKPDHAWCYATTTNREGVATVRVAEPGTWVLRVNLRKPTTGSTREQYDYESYLATLTIEVQP
jgi:uncharacterized GH25 family protein